MGRWEPDAAGRLRAAALELFLDPGFEQTTVADIAARARLTERTFFRYFKDKREVLFAGGEQLRATMVAALAAAPDSAAPMQAVAAALEAGVKLLGGDREFSAQRQQVIYANSELLERELIKLADLSTALAAGLRSRGVPDLAAALAAEAGIGAFRIAFQVWVSEPTPRALPEVMHETLGQLAELTG